METRAALPCQPLKTSVPCGVSILSCFLLNVLLTSQYSLVNEPLIELTNPGASGSLFYLTSDDEFIIKTVQHKEAKFLQRLLPGYYMVRDQNKKK